MAKTVILINLEEDTKDLGRDPKGNPMILGSKLDKGIAGVPQPELEIPPEVYAHMRKNKTLQICLDHWEQNSQIRIR